MHSHLDIQINGKSLVIPDDSSLPVEERNPMFNDVTFFSYPMQIPVEGNREVLKNIAHRDSDMRAMDLEHADVRIFADGLPLNNGQVITQDGSEIKDTFEFNIDAQQQSFSELIGNLECRDVKVKDKILIGKQIGKIQVNYSLYACNYVKCHGKSGVAKEGVAGDPELTDYTGIWKGGKQEINESDTTELEAPQALGFSVPLNINVSEPYPAKQYCNARVAYAVQEDDSSTGTATGNSGSRRDSGSGQGRGGDSGRQSEQKSVNHSGSRIGSYWVLNADRPQSGVCFYVLYFLDCLFAQLGVSFDNSELLEVEDMKRLAFFTTKCSYDLEETSERLGSRAAINQWLIDNQCGGSLLPRIEAGDRVALDDNGNISIDEEYAEADHYVMVGRTLIGYYHNVYSRRLNAHIAVSTKICKMYANSDCFPDASVSSVISSLENSFGIRFLYDPEKKKVTAHLLRNIYKNGYARHFLGKVLSMNRMNEKITGVRMAYSAESESKEQKKNVRYGVKDYDTEFDYIEYPEDRTVLNLHYGDIAKKVSATDMNVYIDLTTGNSYRVKIDADAENPSEFKPVLFQVAQYKGVESGDCSERHQDYVREFVSDFRPLVCNVINANEYTRDTTGDVSPVLAPLLDVEMETGNTPMTITNIILQDDSTDKWYVPSDTNRAANINGPFPDGLSLLLTQPMNLSESYDPTQTDSGNSPLQDIDWGLTVGVMRGAGSGSELIEYDEGYDGFGNSRWKDTIAIYELTSDTMDLKGAIFDYNGTDEGDGGGERFSLSIRSWAQFVYYIDGNGKLHINKDITLAGSAVEGVSGKTWLIPCDDDERDQQGHIVKKIRSRGLFDTFMLPHARFLLERKPYKVRVQATIAQLLDIRNHWTDWYVIDGKVCFINAIKYNVLKATGISESELEVYSW